MKLDNFSGGLATRKDETLVMPNEALLYKNIDNAKGNLTSIKDYTLSGTAIDRWFYKFSDTWYSSTNDREYIEYNNKLYWSEKENYAQKVVSGTVKPLGITAPTVKLTTVDGGTGSISTSSETLQYMYTFYDSSEGIESAPSPVSDELSLSANKEVDISDFQTSSNVFVDKIRIYRIGADATDFTLIVEIDNGDTTYTDNIQTINAIGTILSTYDYTPPPVGLRYFTEAYGIIFAAKNNYLYFSEIGLPDAWPAANTILISGIITGIAAIPDGLAIYINSKAYLLLGTSSANFRLVLLSAEHGCINHNTIKVVKNTLIWVSSDGICSLSGGIQVVTKEKLGRISLNTISATVYSEQYMLTLTDGSLFIFDLRFNPFIFKTIEFNTVEVYNLGVFDNVLYGVINEQIATLFTGRQIDFYYESPVLADGEPSNIKLYNNIYVSAEGEFLFDIYIDGVKVLNKKLNGDRIFELKVPQEYQRGSDIQFKIQGTGVIKEIEYKIAGRENGR
ncbi:MAG: hypothetical protein COV55_02935 [Candidatus Komeilibacteria bacterium CG11_big_fil_rev_8_21_14_0_20_36_20]|uniref:Uncharacterized protein n=1 Tax=Candidatus Komeilibacteria bacterium CG11_big_fil_rev_8_21_14_0_20_36_20 TaxID=1974477 RepID=A0A2H0NF27_9BACT|nr:MAG: hypothetical protein COV55_02935 [Candidatus Komeilibacteria bacterium CG11_big_fil_rev_8_21_14_0_20_36_20]